MKLMFCPKCHDVFKLDEEFRACKCRWAWGRYLSDGVHAKVGGGMPMGIDNGSLVSAIKEWRRSRKGKRITAFTIEIPCATVEYLEES